MRIRRLMSGIMAGVMTLSIGAVSANAETTSINPTATTVSSAPREVNAVKKTLVKGGEADYTLKSATPGKTKFNYSKTGIVKVTCDVKGEVHVVAKKTGSTIVEVTNSKGKRIGAYKFTVVAKKANVLDDIAAISKLDPTSVSFDFSIDMKDAENAALKVTGTVDAKEYTNNTVGMDVSIGIDASDIDWTGSIFSIYIDDNGIVYFDVDTTKNALKSLNNIEDVTNESITAAISLLDQFNTRYIALSSTEILSMTSEVLTEVGSADGGYGENMLMMAEACNTLVDEIKQNGISGLDKAISTEMAAMLEDSDIAMYTKSLEALLVSFRNRVQLTGSGMLTNKDTYKALTISNKNFATFGKTWNAWLTYDAKTPVNELLTLAGAEPVDLSMLKMDYKSIKSTLDEMGTFKLTLKTSDIKSINGKQISLTASIKPNADVQIGFTDMSINTTLKLGTKTNGKSPKLDNALEITSMPEFQDAFKAALKENLATDITAVPYEVGLAL